MRKATRVSLKDLINENKNEIMSDLDAVNEIEKRLEKKQLKKAYSEEQQIKKVL